MDFFQKIFVVWQKVSLTQKALLITIVLTAAGAGWVLVTWAKQPDMQMLYQGLSPEEAAKVVDKISAQDCPYELRAGGTSVWVPKSQVYRLRLDLAKEGLPGVQQTGYGIFDNEKLGVSPFVQNVNFKRALEDELAKSIQMIDGVSYARVSIANTEQSQFVSEATKTSASVVLKLRQGYTLTPANVAAISNMVACSVTGLKPEKVTIVDSQGNLLSSPADNQIAGVAGKYHDYRQNVEASLQKKVEDMLMTILGPDRAVVRVSAVIDMNTVQTVVETPIRGLTGDVAKKEETTTTKETEPAAPGTTPGTGGRNDNKTITEYATGRTVKQETIGPGRIVSLSVSAAVDLYPEDANAATGQNALIMQVTEVEALIRNALGIKTTDVLTVQNVHMYRRPKPVDEPTLTSWTTSYLPIVGQASMGILAVCALLALKVFAKAGRHAVPVRSGAGAQALGAGAAPAGFIGAGPQGMESVTMRRQIAGALKSNPDQVRQLFSSWVQEG